nr:immunoglobulin heavy chain junction region [Macaca mulatta]MOW93958.1 immunoglobulin heavy chain junction region [Macaca mulatta]MOW94373.1 immunoglobulin heavy chain junction region [Macaca mulatta]MOW94620.1 immunoglobulin heavy chain junction region [Macaca mulatta]MOW94646.1 immunoglobulin heavy chain junction region [Macaca mulatta]
CARDAGMGYSGFSFW